VKYRLNRDRNIKRKKVKGKKEKNLGYRGSDLVSEE